MKRCLPIIIIITLALLATSCAPAAGAPTPPATSAMETTTSPAPTLTAETTAAAETTTRVGLEPLWPELAQFTDESQPVTVAAGEWFVLGHTFSTTADRFKEQYDEGVVSLESGIGLHPGGSVESVNYWSLFRALAEGTTAITIRQITQTGVLVAQVTFNITVRPDATARAADIARNEALWHSWGIKDYTFRLEVGRFRPPPSADVLVTVQGGAVAGFEVVGEHGQDVAAAIAPYDTIEKLFTALEQSYHDSGATTGVTYDPVYGFPTFISAYTGPLEVRFAIYISEFTPLEAPAQPAPPVIRVKVRHLMGGSADYFDIYADGYVMACSERKMRLIIPGNHGTRSWQTGRLAAAELQDLVALFIDGGFLALDDSYNFPGQPLESGPPGGFAMGDNFYTFTLSYGDMQKEVSTSAYLKAEDMPPPLEGIAAAIYKIPLNELGQENVY